MMNMFDSYDNMKSTPCFNPPASIPHVDKTYEEYDANGKLVGYFWYQGDTPIIQFVIDGELAVQSNSIIYVQEGQAPDENTVAEIGQKAYNLHDYISWTCVAISDSTFMWLVDDEFSYNPLGNKKIYFNVTDYLSGKEITATFFNFRNEIIYQVKVPSSTTVSIPIDEETTKLFVKGVYSCSLVLFDAEQSSAVTILDNEDCKLIVK